MRGGVIRKRACDSAEDTDCLTGPFGYNLRMLFHKDTDSRFVLSQDICCCCDLRREEVTAGQLLNIRCVLSSRLLHLQDSVIRWFEQNIH